MLSDGGLKCLLLVSDRLKRKAYRKINMTIKEKFYELVANYVSLDPISALKITQRFINMPGDFITAPYSQGLVLGLTNLGDLYPERLNIIKEFPDVAPLLISIEPKIGLLYLNGLDNELNNELNNYDQIGDLTLWISNITAPEILANVRKVLLPEIKNNGYKLLAEELLRLLNENEIPEILDTLCVSTKGFQFEELNQIICDHICIDYPTETRFWAKQTKVWTSTVAKFVAFTYLLNIGGITEFVETNYSPIMKAQILAAIISRLTQHNSLPSWFLEFAKNNNIY